MDADFSQRYPRLAEIIGIDLRSLALFRILLGLVLLGCVLSGLGDAGALWSDGGIVPRTWLIEADSHWRWSLYLINGQTGFVVLLLLVQAALALMLALGWRTRLASIVSFVLWTSLLNRNPLVVSDGDLVLAVLLFWAMLLPLSARYSFDAALSTAPPPIANLHVSWASLGVLLQIVAIPFFTTCRQTGAAWFPDFSAAYYALSLDRQVLTPGRWLLHAPQLLHALSVLIYLLGWLTPLLLLSPYGLRPLRAVTVLVLALLQVGLYLCVDLGVLPLLSLASLAVFIGGWLWDAIGRRQTPAPPLRVYYDRDCGFCLRSCLLLREFLLLPQLQISAAQDTPRARTLLEANRSWVVIDTDEQAYLKWPALLVLLRHSPVFAWLARPLRLNALHAPGNAAYDFIGRHRPALSALTAVLLPQRAVSWDVSRFWQRAAALAAALVLLANLQNLQLLPGFSEPVLTTLQRVLRIDQQWTLFAPQPSREDGWWVIPARLADGREIDLLHPQRAAPDYGKPARVRAEWPDSRWRTLSARLADASFADYRPYYARYLCAQWNEHHRSDAAQRLMTFKLINMLERTPPPGQKASVEQVIALRWECFPDETKGQVP